MKKSHKTFVLLAILLLPTIFVFFLLTGESVQRKLEVFYDLRNPEFDATFLEYNKCPRNFKDSTHRILPFSLTNQLGKTVTEKELEGNIFIVNFILTRCTQNICPVMSSELVRVQEAFKVDSDIKIVSFSIDPTYDQPEVLKKYADLYGADHQKWFFLTGTEEQIFNQAKCSYFLPAQKTDSYINIDHSERFVLVDKKGQIRGFYNGTQRQEVDRLITEIEILRKETVN